MTDYRLDPKNPRRLTPEEARRLDETPIDYSDIPPLGDEFFSQATLSRTTPMLYEITEAIALAPTIARATLVRDQKPAEQATPHRASTITIISAGVREYVITEPLEHQRNFGAERRGCE
jgi:hypothetical protein